MMLTKNIWLSGTLKFYLLPRKALGQTSSNSFIKSPYHFLSPPNKAFFTKTSLSPFKPITLLFQTSHRWFGKASSSLQRPQCGILSVSYSMAADTCDSVYNSTYCRVLKFEAIRKHNRTTENVSKYDLRNWIASVIRITWPEFTTDHKSEVGPEISQGPFQHTLCMYYLVYYYLVYIHC